MRHRRQPAFSKRKHLNVLLLLNTSFRQVLFKIFHYKEAKFFEQDYCEPTSKLLLYCSHYNNKTKQK